MQTSRLVDTRHTGQHTLWQCIVYFCLQTIAKRGREFRLAVKIVRNVRNAKLRLSRSQLFETLSRKRDASSVSFTVALRVFSDSEDLGSRHVVLLEDRTLFNRFGCRRSSPTLSPPSPPSDSRVFECTNLELTAFQPLESVVRGPRLGIVFVSRFQEKQGRQVYVGDDGALTILKFGSTSAPLLPAGTVLLPL